MTTQKVSIAVPQEIEATDTAELTFAVNLAQGYYGIVRTRTSFLAAVKATQQINMDGELSEWQDTMPFYLNQVSQIKQIEDWGGENDLSVRGYLKWDGEYLYMVMIQDDVFARRRLIRISGLETIDPARSRGIGIDGYHELGFALGYLGVIGWRWAAADEKDVGPLPDTVKMAVKRTENITCCEA